MPSKYKRVSTRNSWDENSMSLALEAVQNGIGLKPTANQFNVPRTTLRRRLTGENVQRNSKLL